MCTAGITRNFGKCLIFPHQQRWRPHTPQCIFLAFSVAVKLHELPLLFLSHFSLTLILTCFIFFLFIVSYFRKLKNYGKFHRFCIIVIFRTYRFRYWYIYIDLNIDTYISSYLYQKEHLIFLKTTTWYFLSNWTKNWFYMLCSYIQIQKGLSAEKIKDNKILNYLIQINI